MGWEVGKWRSDRGRGPDHWIEFIQILQILTQLFLCELKTSWKPGGSREWTQLGAVMGQKGGKEHILEIAFSSGKDFSATMTYLVFPPGLFTSWCCLSPVHRKFSRLTVSLDSCMPPSSPFGWDCGWTGQPGPIWQEESLRYSSNFIR